MNSGIEAIRRSAQKLSSMINTTGTFCRDCTSTLLSLACSPHCMTCQNSLDDEHSLLCSRCWGDFQRCMQTLACPTCGHTINVFNQTSDRCSLCYNSKPVINHVARVGHYEQPLKDLILSLKFRHQSMLDAFLGDFLAKIIASNPYFEDVDLLIPIPLHWRRRLQRKYNQAELLAIQASKSLRKAGISIPLCHDLIRIRHTPPQTSLNRSDRLINLKGAFKLLSDKSIRNKHICLIDDVTTTGTTLNVAARELKKAQPRQISAVVLAVAQGYSA